MFEETRKNIGSILARLYFRQNSYQQKDFSKLYTNANSALVIVPEDSQLSSLVFPFLNSLQQKFRGNKLTLVTSAPFKISPGPLSQSKIITISQEQLGFFFLPKSGLVDRLLREKFDLIVDLNISVVPFALYLCRGMNAPLKVGFVKKYSDATYNFQFNTDPLRMPKIRYEQLYRTLTMF